MDLKVRDTLSSGMSPANRRPSLNSCGIGLTTGRPETGTYEICPAVINGDKYIFVDAPGFGAADIDNLAVVKNIMSCLLALGPFVIIASALFPRWAVGLFPMEWQIA